MDFQTRNRECKLMVSLIPTGVVTVLEPTPGEGNLVRALRNTGMYEVITPSTGDFWQVKGEFDAIVMNPPFSPMKTGYQILEKAMTMTSNIIALMPWLTIINGKQRTNLIKNYGLVSVHHLPREAFPGSRVQTCILVLNYGYNGATTLVL